MNRLTLLSLLFALAAPFPLLAADKPAEEKPATKVPPDARRTLAVHKTDAEFTGLVKQPCRHRTAECPDRCDHGGTYAEFKILAYRHHEITGKYGSERAKVFKVRVSNGRDEPKLDAALTAKIAALKAGDRVRLEWTHDYVTRAGASFPEHPVSLIEPLKVEKNSVETCPE